MVLVGFSGGAAAVGGLLLADPQRFAGAAIRYGTLPFDAALDPGPGRLAGAPVSWRRATPTTSSRSTSSSARGTTFTATRARRPPAIATAAAMGSRRARSMHYTAGWRRASAEELRPWLPASLKRA